MKLDSGIRLESDGEQADLYALDEINTALAPIGARIWGQDWSGLSNDLKAFLADLKPSTERVTEVMPHFLLSRERLLEIIVQAGREPHIPGGGELTTLDETHGVSYPQLYVAQEGEDFSRFDRMHVNISADGTPVDDVVQLLCGSGLVVHFRIPSGETFKVYLACPTPDAGWLLTFDCATPFIGSFSGASAGAKAVTQVIGPARWRMEYLE
ncbi:hypothetical protein [Microbulbifer sp. JMSA008]|uniref:hypothetical protein n=1 Tax=Microbulbifer sp. JMSA008 TaxID=3243373 RepID=UPI0040397EF4